MSKVPVVSIVIPTHNSGRILEVVLESIYAQNCSTELYEVIIADNLSIDRTEELAQKYGTRIVKVNGKAPQVCRQRNLGAKAAKGDYILILDSDVELSPNLIPNFIKSITKRKDDKDAWYVPYKIIARNKFLNKIRNFEEEFYRDSAIAAARLIKKEAFWKTEKQYDPKLSSGPADWDFDIQLKLINTKFGSLKDFVYHHEENLTLWEYVAKKTLYIKGSEVYKKKWLKKNPIIYEEMVRKQYNPFYRLFWIFIEKGKWKKSLRNIHLYFPFLAIKVTMSLVYFYHSIKQKNV